MYVLCVGTGDAGGASEKHSSGRGEHSRLSLRGRPPAGVAGGSDSEEEMTTDNVIIAQYEKARRSEAA